MGRSAVVEHEDRFSETTTLLETDDRWRVAKRAVASRHFARSPLLSNFLLYIVAETIQGRSDQITEHEIGVHVFDRPARYRTLEDNIVRSYARQLRRRLTDYFLQEGSSERLHIEIPLGGYIPIFVDAREEASAEALSPRRRSRHLPRFASCRSSAIRIEHPREPLDVETELWCWPPIPRQSAR